MKKIIYLLFFLTATLASAHEPGNLTASAVFLLDYETGRVLYEINADKIIPPASMTKIATMYVVLNEMAKKQIALDTEIIINKNGSSFIRPDGASLMHLEAGQNVTIRQLMTGLAVASGNDAAYALADYISGDWHSFVNLMNQTMQDLDLENLHFVDPDGWSELNQATAREIGLLSRLYINKYPFVLSDFHSVREILYPDEDNRLILGSKAMITSAYREKNTNLLLGKVQGVDGLKTGFIPESGFNFVATAKRNQTRLIAVVMGIQANDFKHGLMLRAEETTEVLEWGFSHFETKKWNSPREIKLPVLKGNIRETYLETEHEIELTLTQKEQQSLLMLIEKPSFLKGPLKKGETVGKVLVFDGVNTLSYPLIINQDIKMGSFWTNMIDSIKIILEPLFPDII